MAIGGISLTIREGQRLHGAEMRSTVGRNDPEDHSLGFYFTITCLVMLTLFAIFFLNLNYKRLITYLNLVN